MSTVKVDTFAYEKGIVDVNIIYDSDEGFLGESKSSILLSSLLQSCGQNKIAAKMGAEVILDFDSEDRLIGIEVVI